MAVNKSTIKQVYLPVFVPVPALQSSYSSGETGSQVRLHLEQALQGLQSPDKSKMKWGKREESIPMLKPMVSSKGDKGGGGNANSLKLLQSRF